MASCSATYIGDFVFIRAAHALKPGEEVTIPWTEPIASLADRTADLAARGTSCYCGLCEAERAEPPAVARRREALLDEFANKFKLGQADDLEVISRIIAGLVETYRGHTSPIRQMLYLPYTALGAVYLSREERVKAAEAFEMALGSLGFTKAHEEYLLTPNASGTRSFPSQLLLFFAPMTAIHIYNYYWHADEYDKAERWFRIARGLDRLLHGGDEVLFRRLYHSFLNI